ncbi:DUF1439 domain-containing protein [Glaciecola sp. SC05]|uniref:DUF1439 domain-containing protein n=1 Tax=Glaciecola sp. SC05 TaxID=1987355 RepID=UPI003528BAD2
MRALAVLSILLLSACSGTQGLSVFSFTNADMESLLNGQLPKLSERMSIMGLPVQFDVNNLKIDIGPDNREVIVLDVDSSAEISAFTLNYPVRLMLKVEGSPYYDSSKKAVFLRDVKLLDSSVDAGGFKGNLGVLNKEALQVINAFLAVNPVYELDMQNPRLAMLSKLPLDMKVVNGAISLVPKL